MPRKRKPTLSLIVCEHQTSRPEIEATRATPRSKERPTVKAGGLFSEALMPEFNLSEDLPADIFFTLPDIISLLKQEIVTGGLAHLSKTIAAPPEEISRLLTIIDEKNVRLLPRIKLALGIARASSRRDELVRVD